MTRTITSSSSDSHGVETTSITTTTREEHHTHAQTHSEQQQQRTHHSSAHSTTTTTVTTTSSASTSAATTNGPEDEFDPFLFIRNLPPLSSTMRSSLNIPCLPTKQANTPRISLALDLDETLVHCSVQPLKNHHFTFNVEFNGNNYDVYVRLRPHLYTFLSRCSEWFEVIIFTASQKIYADKLLSLLDPSNRYFSHRVFRDSCVCVNGSYLKDLTVLGRDLSTTCLVDNSVQAFGYQLDNGIPIETWFDDEEDKELLKLIHFLAKLRHSLDVRPLIRQTFRLADFVATLDKA